MNHPNHPLYPVYMFLQILCLVMCLLAAYAMWQADNPPPSPECENTDAPWCF